VIFRVNLARKDKHVDPTAQVLQPDEIAERAEGDATIRVLVGDGSPVELATPGLVYDVQLPRGGAVTVDVPAEYQGFAYVLDGGATFGSNGGRATPPQLVLLGDGDALTVTDAEPGTRFLLMAAEPIGEQPIWNGPFVD
jgi:quercetin 2,3-dioxygenase